MHKGAIIAALTGALFVHGAQAADSVPGNMPETSSVLFKAVPAGLPGIESLGQVSDKELLESGQGLIAVLPMVYRLIPLAEYASAVVEGVNALSQIGWELGAQLAKRQGRPDPGPWPGFRKAVFGGR